MKKVSIKVCLNKSSQTCYILLPPTVADQCQNFGDYYFQNLLAATPPILCASEMSGWQFLAAEQNIDNQRRRKSYITGGKWITAAAISEAKLGGSNYF